MVSDEIAQLGFTAYHLKGAYALLIGSGVSRSAQILTGEQILNDLISKHVSAREIDPPNDLQEWFRQEYGAEASYSAVLQKMANNKELREKALREYFEPTQDDTLNNRKSPQKAHRAIARLVQAGYIKVILTTNFDRLVEHALEEIGIQATIVDSEQSAIGLAPLQHAGAVIVKLHGDYIRGDLKNTEGELSEYSPNMLKVLKRIVNEYGLIICGWSAAWDIALLETITRRQQRRYQLYYGNYGGNLTPQAQELVTHQQGIVVTHSGADMFFEDLEKVIELYAGKRPRPFNREVAAAEVKRLLGTPNSAIELEELWRRELERAFTALHEKDRYKDCQQSITTKEDFGPWFDAMEDALDVLLELIANLVWYGKGQHGHLLQLTVSRLAEMSNISREGWLRLLPSFLVVWSVGTICAIREDWAYFQFAVINPLVPRWNTRSQFAMSFPAFLYDGEGIEILHSETTKLLWPYRLKMLTRRLDDFVNSEADVRDAVNIFEFVFALITMIETDDVEKREQQEAPLLEQYYSRESWSRVARFLLQVHREIPLRPQGNLLSLSTFERRTNQMLSEYVEELTKNGQKLYHSSKNRLNYPDMHLAFTNGIAIRTDL